MAVSRVALSDCGSCGWSLPSVQLGNAGWGLVGPRAARGTAGLDDPGRRTLRVIKWNKMVADNQSLCVSRGTQLARGQES